MPICHFCRKLVFTGSKSCGTMIVRSRVYHYHIKCLTEKYSDVDFLDLFLSQNAEKIFDGG